MTAYGDGIVRAEPRITADNYSFNWANLNWGTSPMPAAFFRRVDGSNATYSEMGLGEPTTPQGLTASNITGTTLDLTWGMSSDNIKVTGYNIYNGSTLVATVTSSNQWSAQTMPNSSPRGGMAYGNGVFVVLPGSTPSDAALYSTNGVTWIATTMPSAADWSSVAYGNGMFVAVSLSGGKIATSQDGITWTARSNIMSATWNAITFGSGKFVLVGNLNQSAMTTNAVDWTYNTMPQAVNWNMVAHGNGYFVATASSSAMASSANGTSWITRTAPVTGYWSGLTYGAGLFLLVGEDTSVGANAGMTSPTGTTWTRRDPPEKLGRVVYNNGLFVATPAGSSLNGYVSTNAINWTVETMPSSSSWSKLAAGNGLFVSLGSTNKSATYDLAPVPFYTATIDPSEYYSFTVRAVDNEGNLSVPSNVVTYGTPPAAQEWKVYDEGVWKSISSMNVWNGTSWEPAQVWDGDSWIGVS